jgi:hypothetical protein
MVHTDPVLVASPEAIHCVFAERRVGLMHGEVERSNDLCCAVTTEVAVFCKLGSKHIFCQKE